MFYVFKQLNVRNRAYVIDNKGNKLFYGTVYQCGKFINYMNDEGGSDDERIRKHDCAIAEQQNRDPLDELRKTVN